jgi:hypothetical protein
MALVLLKTGIGHPGDADYDTMNDSLAEEADLDGAEHSSAGRIKYDAAQMATAQKLLLFWRKPAVRFCSSRYGVGGCWYGSVYMVNYLLAGREDACGDYKDRHMAWLRPASDQTI